MSLKQTVRTKISENFIGALLNCKESHQNRTNLVKDENSDLLAGSQNFLNRWQNYFGQLSNGHSVNYVRQNCIQLSY